MINITNFVSKFASNSYDYFFGVMSNTQLEEILDQYNTKLGLIENNERHALLPIITKLSSAVPAPLTEDENKTLNKNFTSLVNGLNELNSLDRKIDDYLLNSKNKNRDLLQRFAPYRTRFAALEKLKTDLILIINNPNPIAQKSKFQRINEKAIRPLGALIAKTLKASETLTGRKSNVAALAMLGLYATSLMRPSTAICFTASAYIAENLELKKNKANLVAFASFLAYSASLLSLPTTALIAAAGKGAEIAINQLRKI
jgi:hypothetical protein